jgi:bifunctional non-homologous end joining protein LigD
VPRGRELRGRERRDLRAYRAKRDADRTPEPFGAEEAGRPGLFVVQQHAARRLHYDLRLEWGGVLLSWAVPKGPSLDPAEKRLAVQVEDHPVEYADFEGKIPEGNYGAGSVIVWDLGRWTPVEDPDEGLVSGKLLFDLHGYKLRGRFTLVRTGGKKKPDGRRQVSRSEPKASEDHKTWLLIKKPDAFASDTADPNADASVLSGLTLEERRNGSPRLAELGRAIAGSGAPRGEISASALSPMLAERIEQPFSSPDWLFEVKYDGYRMIGAREGGEGVLFTRNGRPAAARFPEIARALAALPVESAIVDGEVALTDAEGRPSFALLQQRAALSDGTLIAAAAVASPVTYFVFDLLAFGDRDVRDVPLRTRKEWLAQLVPPLGPLRLAPWFAERGEAVYAEIRARGLEGMVAKRIDSPYRSGRGPLWKKLRLVASDDFAIVGYTPARGGRPGFSALHLASHVNGELRYFGRVGTGFRDAELTSLREALDALRRPTPACVGAVPQTRGNVWVEPRLVGEVSFTEVTHAGSLRHPLWIGLREDKEPSECVREGSGSDADAAEPEPPLAPVEPESGAARTVPFTNLEKVFWPGDGATKGDLIDYYRRIAPWLLLYLRDRPLVMTRYPDGIDGKSFFQKDAPAWVPDWVRTEQMWSEHAEREVNYFVCDDLESLLYVINMGTIPLHVWASRVGDLQHPDWCILDLDPKGAPFADVVAIANEIREICGELELPACPKTSGSSGVHVLLPLGGRLTFAQCQMLAELLARLVVRRCPEIATVARNVRAREGKVYVDFLQNGHGRLLVAPFSVRPLPGAPVSMPLRWSEVNARLDPRRYTIHNALTRMRRLGADPLAPVLGPAPDLARALARLAEMVTTGSAG